MNTNVFLAFFWLILGFIFLAFSSNWLVSGASALAKKLGVPSLIIGLTIISIGTSSPEVATSVFAAIHGNQNIALGNAIGSNIANIGLIVGFTSLIIPFTIKSSILKKEFTILFFSMIITGFFMLNKTISRIDGIILFLCAILVIIFMIIYAIYGRRRKEILAKEYSEEIITKISYLKASFLVFIGLVILLFSAHIIINNAVKIALYFKISDLMIGLTVLAIGTSLPELATTITGIIKNEYDLIIGNILGSNIFNLLFVISCGAIIKPIAVGNYAIYRDYIFMFIITILLCCFIYIDHGKEKIKRWEGGILFAVYIGYLITLYFIRARIL